MYKVLISGQRGLIGTALADALRRQGAQIVALTRKRREPSDIEWNPTEDRIEVEALRQSGCNVVVHLAGESVVGRWNSQKKQSIYQSRVEGTRLLVRGMREAGMTPSVFVCSSAVGIYGDRGDEQLDESSVRGTGFLAEVAADWEAEADRAQDVAQRVVKLRTGIVLSRKGGALTKMLPAFRLGLGGRLGTGQQWMSWVHLDDLVGIILHSLKAEEVRGPVNGTAPEPVRNEEFTRLLARALHRPALLPVPRAAAKLVLGEFADEALVASMRVLPAAALRSGYAFRYARLQEAFASLV